MGTNLNFTEALASAEKKYHFDTFESIFPQHTKSKTVCFSEYFGQVSLRQYIDA